MTARSHSCQNPTTKWAGRTICSALPATSSPTYQSYGRFLNAQKETHSGPDLLDRWTPAMETQVNVAAGNGERVEGKGAIYSDGVNKWWNIRIPKNAKSEPEFKDSPLSWPLEEHAD